MDPGETLESPRGVYKIVKMLGRGGFGEVYLTSYTAEGASNSEQVALKKIALHGMDEKKKEECKKEAKVMERISKSPTNQHIVKYLDSFMITEVNSPRHGNLYIAMDYCSHGDLSSKIKTNVSSGEKFDPETVYDYIYQIADGINELHVKHKVAHRDLKPVNILIAWENEKEVLKISDFGLVKEIDSLSSIQSHSKWCGTELYMSPEQRGNIKCRFPVVDIWAIGIIFYELCIAPKRLRDEMEDLREKVKNDQRVTLPNQYLAADTTWLNKMIANDPNKRMSALQVRDEARDQNNRNQSNNGEEILFYFCYRNNTNNKTEGRIGLFNSYTCLIEEIAKFDNLYWPFQVAITQNKIFGIMTFFDNSFEIYDLNTRQISRGPDPPEWRHFASVVYFKDKLYYLGGEYPKTYQETSRVDVLIDGKWETGPAFPLPIKCVQTITCDGVLYVIDKYGNNKIYRLSDNERKWIEIGEIPEMQGYSGIASLNGRIHITGGLGDNNDDSVLKSCLCFDPSAPANNRISRIADMNYAREDHSLIVANGKLYTIGGFQNVPNATYCNSIEEYDPQTNKWKIVRENAISSETITRQALGRISQLGDLYDASTDCFCGNGLFTDNLPKSTIILTEIGNHQSGCVYQDSFREKFQKLEVEDELQVSFLAGGVKVGGHGRFLNESSDSLRKASASSVYKITTVHESVNVNHQTVVSLISPDAITNASNATHFVKEIQWGAIAIATLKYTMKENDDENRMTIVRDVLKSRVAAIKINGDVEEEIIDSTHVEPIKLEFEFLIDSLPNGDDRPQTYEQGIAFMKTLRSQIANTNGGKGVPIQYTLMPLSSIKQYLGPIESPMNRSITPINVDAIHNIVRIFDELHESERKLNDICDEFEKHSYCVMDDALLSVFKQRNDVRNARINIKKQLFDTIPGIRNGTLEMNEIQDIIQDFNNSQITRWKIDNFIASLKSHREKIKYAILLKNLGVIYVGRGMQLEDLRMTKNIGEFYVFFFHWKTDKLRMANKELFYAQAQEHKIPCILVDVDVQPGIVAKEGLPDGNRICHYVNNEYAVTDVLDECMKFRRKCRFRCTEERTPLTSKPNNRVNVSLICPQSLRGPYCKRDEEHEWYCINCEKILQYDFDGHFLCNCGRASIYTFEFKCSDPKHGTDFTKFDESRLKILADKIRHEKEINILILGETGVGKSTWINGFANYLAYSSLKEAERGEQIYLVPYQFTITNAQYEQKFIQVGQSENESFEVGQSSTQAPQCYVFNVGKKVIRLIDTPGIGDIRGTNFDDENFAAIVRYISYFSELHGICILLKPNNAKLSILFRYLINEVLTHFHVKASANIAFCFTNSRGTFYRPGDTLSVLKVHLENLRRGNDQIQIATSRETLYCMDNEAFIFLCLLHAGERFSDTERANYEASWKKSVEETFRLLAHFENDVQAYDVRNILTLVGARSIILTLAKPLADIGKNIQDNIAVIKNDSEKLKQIDLKNLSLEGKLNIPQVGIRVTPLEHPRTVCTAMECVETKRMPGMTGITKTIYKTVCHDKCRLADVTPEQLPNPKLQKCSIFNKNTLLCRKDGCGHLWSVHIHILYAQEPVIEMVEDPDIRRALQEQQSEKQMLEILIKSREDRVEKYLSEQEIIDKISVKFGAFLKANSILVYNDVIEEYLKFSIKEVENRANNTNDPDTIRQVMRLREQLDQYKEARRVLDKRLENKEEKLIKSGDIKTMQEQLITLPLTGGIIKQLFDANKNDKENNFRFNETIFHSSRNLRGSLHHPYIPPPGFDSDNGLLRTWDASQIDQSNQPGPSRVRHSKFNSRFQTTQM